MGIQYSDLSPGSSLRSEFPFSTSRFKGEEIDRLQQTEATSEKTEGALARPYRVRLFSSEPSHFISFYYHHQPPSLVSCYVVQCTYRVGIPPTYEGSCSCLHQVILSPTPTARGGGDKKDISSKFLDPALPTRNLIFY